MKVHRLQMVQKLPVPVETAWDFFSRPGNLQVITPAGLSLVCTSETEDHVFSGQIIQYRVKPLFGIAVTWITEILEVETGKYFIDVQRKGPYKLWRHEHYFRQIEGGTEMTDIVFYKAPYGWLGRLANRWIVEKQLRLIFQFRYEKATEMFGNWSGQQFQPVFEKRRLQ